jgi:competence CoiA-like predicted nuclease
MLEMLEMQLNARGSPRLSRLSRFSTREKEERVLVALDGQGHRVVARGELSRSEAWSCQCCGEPMIYKWGEIKIPHFAHYKASGCAASGETMEHLEAKRFVVEQFELLDRRCELEVVLEDHSRRIDVVVYTSSGHQVAVELQQSPISVDEILAREADHRRYGYYATVWIFVTGKTYSRLLSDEAVRVPKQVFYLWRKRRQVLLLRIELEQLYVIQFRQARKYNSFLKRSQEAFIPYARRIEVTDIRVRPEFEIRRSA